MPRRMRLSFRATISSADDLWRESGLMGFHRNLKKECRERVLLGLLVCLCFFDVWGLSPARAEESSQKEEALRKRVTQFYQLLQLGRQEQAEAYVAEETKENYRAAVNSSPFLGFEIESIKLDSEGSDATVTVRVQIITLFAPAPVALLRTTRWRLVSGTWHVVVPKSESVQSAFRPPTTKPQPERLDFKARRVSLGTLQPGGVRTARFPFTNVSDKTVTITEIVTDCECLRPKMEKKTYMPGESGELSVEFDPSGRQDHYEQGILVKTEPGGGVHRVVIAAYIVPPRVPAKTESQAKPRASQTIP